MYRFLRNARIADGPSVLRFGPKTHESSYKSIARCKGRAVAKGWVEGDSQRAISMFDCPLFRPPSAILHLGSFKTVAQRMAPSDPSTAPHSNLPSAEGVTFILIASLSIGYALRFIAGTSAVF